MTLTPGSKLGSYEVLSLLGAGGMGEVYRARDARLGRVVAIKVLPAERMADENRRRRFVQEARAASALNHPNIVTIHEIESADGIDFIVMEYVPGKTLDTVIPRHGMKLGEVLRIAIPIADAVARAHATGIVHRDLKPANVVVGSDGAVKVLDFGLAKLVAQEEAVSPESETRSQDGDAGPLSRSGAVAGTAGYMSPEQATGKKVDTRSDVFSFGAVLYELVTGRRAFVGNSTAETLAAVLREQPKAPSEVVTGLPKELERLILRCLQKDPDRRFQHMADVKVELNEIKEESDSAPTAPSVPARRRRLVWGVMAISGVLLVAAGSLVWRLNRSNLASPRLVVLTSTPGYERRPTFSPDGNQLTFSWDGEKASDGRTRNFDIWLKMIGGSVARRLTTNDAYDDFPSWSPDGREIAFLRFPRSGDTGSSGDPGTIHVVSALGGPDRKLSDLAAAPSQLSWSADGRFLAASRFRAASEPAPAAGGIYLIAVPGGEAHPLTLPNAPGFDVHPGFSPDGRYLAYASCIDRLIPFRCDIQTMELGDGFVPQGSPRRLTRQAVEIGGLAWARDGRSLVYDQEGAAALELWRVEAAGDHPPERIELSGAAACCPATTPAQDRLAFSRYPLDFDIYKFEAGRAPEPVVASSALDHSPAFSPDGRRIAFTSERTGLPEVWLADADGSNQVQLTHGPGRAQGSPRFSPDGYRIAFDSKSGDGRYHIWTIGADGGSPRRLTEDPLDENLPSWSRDGSWIYFASSQAGASDIWRAPAGGGKAERVTRTGAYLAYEAWDGKTLFFTRRPIDSPLFALPLGGGAERQVADCVWGAFPFAVGPDGVYYLGCAAGQPEAPLHLLSVVSGRDGLLGKVETGHPWNLGMAVAPNGAILFSKWVSKGSDLMMIENFR